MLLKSSEVVENIQQVRNDYMRFAYKWEFAQVFKTQGQIAGQEKGVYFVWFNMFRLCGKEKLLIIHQS